MVGTNDRAGTGMTPPNKVGERGAAGMGNAHDDRIVHRELDTDVEEPAVRISEHVGDLKDRDPTTLATTHNCIDGVLDHIFSTPPSPEAQIEITFSYEGYRITVEQNGHARFVELE